MKSKLLKVLAIAAVSILGFGIATAQQAAPAPETANATAADAAQKPGGTEKIAGKSLMDMWRAGGMTMYPLALCAIACISLAIVNGIQIRAKKFASAADVDALTKLLNQKDVDGAIEYCEKHPTPLTNILGAGLARVSDKEIDWETIEVAMEESSMQEMAAPYVMVNYLALIASISPMLGLFGTVTGMVKAFNTIAAEGAGSAQKLADNISEALITTATGMIIGIPAMIFYFIFKNQYSKAVSGLSSTVGSILYVFKISTKYGPQDLSDAPAEAPSAK